MSKSKLSLVFFVGCLLKGYVCVGGGGGGGGGRRPGQNSLEGRVVSECGARCLGGSCLGELSQNVGRVVT